MGGTTVRLPASEREIPPVALKLDREGRQASSGAVLRRWFLRRPGAGFRSASGQHHEDGERGDAQ